MSPAPRHTHALLTVCSAVQCSDREDSEPPLEKFLVRYYAHQTQLCIGRDDLLNILRDTRFKDNMVCGYAIIANPAFNGVLQKRGSSYTTSVLKVLLRINLASPHWELRVLVRES